MADVSTKPRVVRTEDSVEYRSARVGGLKTAVSGLGPTEKPADALHRDVSVSVKLPVLPQCALESLVFHLFKPIPCFVTGDTESYRSSQFPQFTFSPGHRSTLSPFAFAFQWQHFGVGKLSATTPHTVLRRCMIGSQKVHRPRIIHWESRLHASPEFLSKKSEIVRSVTNVRRVRHFRNVSKRRQINTPQAEIPLDHCHRKG